MRSHAATLAVFNQDLRRLTGLAVTQDPLDRQFGFVIEYLGYLNIHSTPSLSSPGSSGHPGSRAQSLAVPDTERSGITALIEAINARNRKNIAEHNARAAEARAVTAAETKAAQAEAKAAQAQAEVAQLQAEAARLRELLKGLGRGS